ncbi:MAG: hypothetical protein HY885_13445 [Deltaproteobacteria bacterium]|nr:hypothetical protein [Deltaproteobacteria bacterium]
MVRCLSLACCLGLFFLSGCAGLPKTARISDSEKSALTDRFVEVISRQRNCHCCIDAQATVAFSSLWRKGTLNGFLQAMSPSYLKFVGINPLGQTMVVFVTDGASFRYVSVLTATEFEGPVDGTTYAKYAPEGFLPEHGFYWLIGRLYPGKIQILDVTRDEDGGGYWFEISYGNGTKSLVLFAEESGVFLRHIVLNEEEEKIFNVSYDDYSEGSCPLPGKVTVASLIHDSTMELRLADWLPEPAITVDDFSYDVPAAYKRVVVK